MEDRLLDMLFIWNRSKEFISKLIFVFYFFGNKLRFVVFKNVEKNALCGQFLE
jgi:hypothetical protein